MLSVAVLTSNPKTQSHVPLPHDVLLVRRPPRVNREAHDRETYDRETAEILQQHGADVVVLIGYLYIVTRPLLRAFPGRIVNIHDGTPQYPGLHATRDAIIAGERETYSIVHVVTEDLDRGPLLVQSEPFPVAPFVHCAVAAGEHDIVRAYAYAQREWMMRSSWGELAAEAIERLALEAVA